MGPGLVSRPHGIALEVCHTNELVHAILPYAIKVVGEISSRPCEIVTEIMSYR